MSAMRIGFGRIGSETIEIRDYDRFQSFIDKAFICCNNEMDDAIECPRSQMNFKRSRPRIILQSFLQKHSFKIKHKKNSITDPKVLPHKIC